jgi:PAS domain S-box-containing protein
VPEKLKMPEPESQPIAVADGASPAAPAAAAPLPAAPEPKGVLARIERKTRHWLGPKPISRKMTAITMLACTAALVLSGIIFFTFDIASQYLGTRTALQSLSRVAAENSRDPLERGSSQAVLSTLNALMDYPHVTGAMIYRADGRTFARPTKRVKAVLPGIMPSDAPMGTYLGFTSLIHYEPVMHGAQKVGTLAIEIGLSEFWERLRIYAVITLVVFFLASLVARLLLARLQGMISEPVVELAQVADTVAKDNNYALRAEKRSEDEVGHLVETFNNMLSEIQKRDAALSQAQVDLEMNVMMRTSELHNEVLERKQAEDAMKDSEQRYRNLFENNPMPMFVMDLESLGFVAVNNAAIRHYGYRQPEFLLLSLPAITKDADPLDIERAFRTSQTSFDAGGWRHKKRTGEVIEVELTAHTISFAGKIAKIVLANDVTERNSAQRQLDEMHRKLVEASRAAGMAEVATGVLHNVGNVLNSVNVSANVLADSVRKSKASSIRKIADLLDANKADLAAFFGKDGKGQLMPNYLVTLAQQFETEQQTRLAEIEQLTKNIAHIKDIVAMQQDYAKVAGVMEDFAPRTLLDEALRMASPELSRCSVHVETDCPDTLPMVNTDRHKVLQILVNLITNAQQAMEETPAAERRLTITAAYEDGGQMVIVIRDNGCGIEKENLTRVFNHGFTTKTTGHGFGLHSAANAATEIGGSLSGTSDGPGKGATFTLKLPLAQPDAARKAA